MKFENVAVFNFEGAFRGMRNPKNSWDMSDSDFTDPTNPVIGKEDMRLAQTLIRAGNEHRKFLRQIFVSVDITAPLYWWKEFDTYKVGTVANSTSTMHKILSSEITIDNFQLCDYKPDLDIGGFGADFLVHDLIEFLERLRRNALNDQYDDEVRKAYWKELIRWLPCGFLQKRTVTMSYENLLSMASQRHFHKLTEWRCDFMMFVRCLPYANELILYNIAKDSEEEA